MRHQVAGKKLGRDISSRQALLANLADDLIASGAISTTLAKAKFTRPYIERLITLAKGKKLLYDRKIAPRVSKDALNKLIKVIGPGFAKRSGGYTRIVKVGRRLGDGAIMARLELLPIDKKEKPVTAEGIVPTAKDSSKGRKSQ